MRILTFGGYLGLGGAEKAACRWAVGLRIRGHDVTVLAMELGPRTNSLLGAGIPVVRSEWTVSAIQHAVSAARPDVVHIHAPGFPSEADLLGRTLAICDRPPVVQTNIFGRLENPVENTWTDFRLFISWMSCVQAAKRSFLPLNESVFARSSVAVYPLDPDDGPSKEEISRFRLSHGVAEGEILFGRFSRPEPNKWTDLPVEAFRLALRRNPSLKLLLREPPPAITKALCNASDRDRFLILPATADLEELRLTMASVDVVLHTSSIGESFGYGIAEPMNFGRPVIANSVPWGDQAQLELVRHGECGFVASTPQSMSEAILRMAADTRCREQMGRAASIHIRRLADPTESLNRLEMALQLAIEGRSNPNAKADLAKAKETAAYLDCHQLGHGWRERLALAPFHYRVRFHQWRRAWKRRLAGRLAPSMGDQ